MSFSNNKEMVEENLPHNEELVDDVLLNKSDFASLTEHNQKYTELLDAYVNNVVEILSDKRKKKQKLYNFLIKFPIGVVAAAFIVIVLIVLLGFTNDSVGMSEMLPPLVTVFGTIISTYITIFKLITGYLFNKEEEKTMASIIGKIQDYDINVREKIKKSNGFNERDEFDAVEHL